MNDGSPEARLDLHLRRQALRSPAFWGLLAFFTGLGAVSLFFLASPKPETRFFLGQVLAPAVVSSARQPSAPALAIRVDGQEMKIRVNDPLLWKPPGETVCVGETAARFFGIVTHKIWPDWYCR